MRTGRSSGRSPYEVQRHRSFSSFLPTLRVVIDTPLRDHWLMRETYLDPGCGMASARRITRCVRCVRYWALSTPALQDEKYVFDRETKATTSPLRRDSSTPAPHTKVFYYHTTHIFNSRLLFFFAESGDIFDTCDHTPRPLHDHTHRSTHTTTHTRHSTEVSVRAKCKQSPVSQSRSSAGQYSRI